MSYFLLVVYINLPHREYTNILGAVVSTNRLQTQFYVAILQRLFDGLKAILSSSEVLAFPDFGKPFHLTSNYALGALLFQDIEGKDRPIAYITRTLSKTEENYATIEKEMLSILWALDNLRS